MLYRLDTIDIENEQGPLIDDGRITICRPNPDSNAARLGLSPDCEFAMWSYVENADFHRMAMTSTGTVVFLHTDGPRVLVDEEALATGRVLLVDLGHDGRIEAGCRVRPCVLYNFWQHIENLGKSVRAVMTSDIWKSPTFSGP